MKKLTVALSAVMLGVCTNAAVVTWQTNQGGSLINPSGTAEWGESKISMYVFSLTSEQWLNKGYGTIAADAVCSQVWKDYGSSLATATGSQIDSDGNGFLAVDVSGYGTETAYAAVIMTYQDTVGGDITYYKGNVGSWEFTSSEDKTVYDMDTKVFGSEIGTVALDWQPVPEPFSGTLALLGMGVVALRRRMKKAKK